MTPEPQWTGETTGRLDGPPMAPEAIFALIQPRLEAVGREVDSSLISDAEIVSAMGDYLSSAGGKRMRPALLLLAAGLVGYKGDRDLLFGTVFELIHTATLVHDDIIDEASMRRGRPSMNRRWGNHLTVLMGDHLYLKAMKLAIAGGDLRILDLLAETTLGMIEGEMIQKDQNGRIDIDEAEHLEVVRRKTALLFSACCRVPPMLAGADPVREQALADYGLDLGMAFQLVDDLLDFTGDEQTLGKPTLNDLREGKLTLPLIDLLGRGDIRHLALVRRVMEDRGFERVPREEILRLVRENGCLDRGRVRAARYAERARAHLAPFPDGPYRDALSSVLDLVLLRNR